MISFLDKNPLSYFKGMLKIYQIPYDSSFSRKKLDGKIFGLLYKYLIRYTI